MTIGLFTSVYFNNIGNGFIDLGAEATIKEALPLGGEIVKLSQCANFAATMGKGMFLKELPGVHWLWETVMSRFAKNLHDQSYKMVKQQDVFSVAEIAKLDYFIIPGCVLTVPFFTIYGALLKRKVEEGTKLIFLGASGNFYTDYEIEFVSGYLKALKPLAIMTRDSIAFKHYSVFSGNSFNGIDNAFFVNRWHLPEVKTSMDPFVILNFDERKHKSIEKDLKNKFKNIIYTNHKPYPYYKVGKLVKRGVMVSDTPLDYLFLYSNTTQTYSDRVHACIPTLSFGHEARLYSDSPRIALFENVGVKHITHKTCVIGQGELKEMQSKQISYLRSLLE